MMQKNKGIVLHHVKYGESGIIIYMFTRNFGRQTFIVQGIRQKKALIKINIFQPLYILKLETYHKPGKEIHRIKEAKIHKPFHNISNNIYKSTIVLFLSEILYRSLKTEEPDYRLFDFIESSLEILDKLQTGYANFHLIFLLNLSRFLGFQPDLRDVGTSGYFDLKEGVMRDNLPAHSLYLSKMHSKIFAELNALNYESMGNYKISHTDRNLMTEHLLDYFQLHELNLTPIKSFKILKEVFS